MIKRAVKSIIVGLIAAAAIYLALAIYADYELVLRSFSKFNWLFIPLVLLLSYLNYHTRFLKWDYYLRLLNIKLPWKDSYGIFMSGLIMSITPGKMGELLKTYIVKKITGEPISKSAPIVFAERITDFISVVLLALIGAIVYDYGKVIVIATGIFFLLTVYVISNKVLALKLISFIKRITFLKKYIFSIESAYQSSYDMLRPIPLIKMVSLSIISWFFECLGFYIILINFGMEISLMWAVFAYAFATIIGSITMLPAGLGVTDGSLTFLIIREGFPQDLAVAATIIIRAATLWFAILVGIVSLLLYQKRIGKLSEIQLG